MDIIVLLFLKLVPSFLYGSQLSIQGEEKSLILDVIRFLILMGEIVDIFFFHLAISVELFYIPLIPFVAIQRKIYIFLLPENIAFVDISSND